MRFLAILARASMICCLIAASVPPRAAAQETFSSGSTPGSTETYNGSALTGTQGVQGNPDCAPPTVIENGVPVTPLNWSCNGSSWSHQDDWYQGGANPCDGATFNATACNEQRCAHNPQLTVCGQQEPPQPNAVILREPPQEPQYQQVPGLEAVKPCTALGSPSDNFLTPQQMQELQQAIATAKLMLNKTQKAVDANVWDVRTNVIAARWFGDSSLPTQQLIRARVDKEVAKLNQMSPANFWPSSPPADHPDACAYVHPDEDDAVYLTPSFWSQTPSFRAITVVHELSHYTSVGGTKDYSYDADTCLAAADKASDWGAQVGLQLLFQPPPRQIARCNASSFQNFVAEMAGQSIAYR